MINLLPKENRRQLHAMRQNNLLRRYVIASMLTLTLVVGIHVGTFALLRATKNQNETSSKDTSAQVEEYKQVQADAKEYAANLATAKQIFESKIPYTDAMINLASQLPKGVVLNEVSLDQSKVNQPTILAARATSMDTAIKLKDVFNASSIARDVSIASVSDDSATSDTGGSSEGANSRYPISVSLNITFTEELLRPQESK